MSNVVELSHEYTAGLFDGEGCFTIYFASGGSTKRKYLTACARIEIREELIIDLLKSKYGGVKQIKRGRKENHSDTFTWTIKSEVLFRFIEQVQPFLILKRKQSEVIVDFINIRRFKYSSPVTHDQLDHQLICKERIHELNRKGKYNE